jgi:hypothetical protein
MGISEIMSADEGFIGLRMTVSDRGVHWGMWVEKKADSSVNVDMVLVAENA